MAAAMALVPFHHHLLLLLLLLLRPSSAAPASQTTASSDAEALLLLKSSFRNATALPSWDPDNIFDPCDHVYPWEGVVCLTSGIITGLRLSGMQLSGSINIEALTHLKGLRTLSFINNSFYGPIPAFGRLRGLKSLFLSHNHFSGPIAADFFSRMTRLKKLWLNDNAFTGRIPVSLSHATALLELHLEDNQFTGAIPALVLPSLVDFNVSNNDLEGAIPDTYSKFNVSSFMGNDDLCGELVDGKPCTYTTVPSTSPVKTGSGKVVALCVIALILMLLAMYSIKAHDTNKEQEREVVTLGKVRKDAQTGEAVPGKPAEDMGQAGAAGGGGGSGDLVMVNEEKGKFRMSDLMKAEAEVIGSGGLGSAYKAVMENGVAVVVKRLREMNRVGKESFDAEMARLRQLNHPNLLPLLAYHYRKEEKLLISQFVPKGSLLYILHGDRGANHAALDWPTRLKIALGIVRGLAYLHEELPLTEVPHGNLKSGNILLSSTFDPLICDYGFLPLVNSAQAATAMQALRSPEAIAGRPVSPRSDVYCFGVLLLELLTGKFPAQYLTNVKGGTDVVQWATVAMAEGREAEVLDPAIVAGAKASVPEMTRLVRTGVECAEPEPDRRLGLKEAAERIEEVAAIEAQKPPPVRGHAECVKGGLGDRSSPRRSVGERSTRQMASNGGSMRQIAGNGDQSGRRKDDGSLLAMS